LAIVWNISVIQFTNSSLISGVILKKKPYLASNKKSLISNVIMIIGSYFTDPFSEEEIEVSYNNIKYVVKTDTKGAFSIPFNEVIEEPSTIQISENNNVLAIIQKYPLFFKKNKSGLTVVSDIDETIMVSYTKSFIKRVFTTLFTAASKRKVIPFTEGLYAFLKSEKPHFFYVSKSEYNLFFTISNFILMNKLPKGYLFLTPYLNFWQLVKSKKDANFKYKNISLLIEHNPEQQFILVGDDSQHDMEIYTKIAKQFESNIKSIYIRQTQKKINDQQLINWNSLKGTGIDAHYFKHNEDFSKTYHTN